jgi:anti-sigma B factor antagonist
MEMTIRQEGAIKVLSCQGRFDAQVADQFKHKLRDVIEQGDIQIILDLGGVVFLDSSGLGALVASQRKIKEKKGELKLAGPQPEVRSVFDITRVSRLFHICKDVPEAVQAFQTPR